MERDDLDDESKVKMYNNALQRYLRLDEAWVAEPVNVAVTSTKTKGGGGPVPAPPRC